MDNLRLFSGTSNLISTISPVLRSGVVLTSSEAAIALLCNIPITSPSLTRVCLGGLDSSTSDAESKICSPSVSGTSSTLSEASGFSSTLSEAETASELESALTTKLGLAMRGLQRREIEVEINGKLREPNVEAVQEEVKHSFEGGH